MDQDYKKKYIAICDYLDILTIFTMKEIYDIKISTKDDDFNDIQEKLIYIAKALEDYDGFGGKEIPTPFDDWTVLENFKEELAEEEER